MILSNSIDFYQIFKNIAFSLDAEKAHHYSLKTAEKIPQIANFFNFSADDKYCLQSKHLKTKFPVGLAAGLDKNARCIDFFSRLNFGFVEVGTITPKPQEGNPRPRLFRLKKENSLLNRMGFNNEGMEQVKINIQNSPKNSFIGINLGKNKNTPEDRAIDDYKNLYNSFKAMANYLVINISSPNTKGLRNLQNESFLTELISSLSRQKNDPPLFLKLAPDLTDKQLMDLTTLAMKIGFNGLIATNTCIREDIGQGGVSGALLRPRAEQVRSLCLKITKDNPDFDFIGVGGIDSFNDLWKFWKEGGMHAQVYSGFIYKGPALLSEIKTGIDQKLKNEKLDNLQELLNNIKFVS